LLQSFSCLTTVPLVSSGSHADELEQHRLLC